MQGKRERGVAGKIIILHTGGTIGMAQTAEGLAPDAGFAGRLRAALAGVLTGALAGVAVEVRALARTIDSSEASPEDWRALAVALQDIWGQADGFVVLHGTDTMAYSAAALSFMLRGADRPVVLTGAQYPMVQPGSDGLGNVLTALQCAAAGVPGVFIAFDGRLLRGTRATKVSTRSVAAFDCPNDLPVGRVTGGRLELTAGLTGALSGAFSGALPAMLPGAVRFDLPVAVPGRIASLRFVPGLSAAALEACLAQQPGAIILECYGSGNVPALGGATAQFLATAAARGIAVVALTQVYAGGTSLGTYAAGSLLVRHGVIDGGSMTFEAVFAKLHHLLAGGAGLPDIRAAMAQDWAGEHGPTMV
jgi:L-asparaginase